LAEEDAIKAILNRENVIKYINDKKTQLREVFASLVYAYETIFPDAPIRLTVLGPLLWDLVKWETRIQNLFLLHDKFDKERDCYGGPLSTRVVEEIMKMIEVDLQDIKLKKV
jgi:hypothetical protein